MIHQCYNEELKPMTITPGILLLSCSSPTHQALDSETTFSLFRMTKWFKYFGEDK